MEIYDQTTKPTPHLILGLPNPGDDYVAIVENVGDEDFNLVLRPGTGIYIKVKETPQQE